MLAKLIEFISNHYVLFTLFVVLLVTVIVQELRRGAKSLNNQELTRLVNSDQGVVLDIRSSKDFATGSIVNALHIPYDKLASRIAELNKHQDKTLIVVDAMGQQAGSACQILSKAGFETVKLSGGMSGWRNDNLPVVK